MKIDQEALKVAFQVFPCCYITDRSFVYVRTWVSPVDRKCKLLKAAKRMLIEKKLRSELGYRS